MIIKAKFKSVCPVCDKPIAVGDIIWWERCSFPIQAEHEICRTQEQREKDLTSAIRVEATFITKRGPRQPQGRTK